MTCTDSSHYPLSHALERVPCPVVLFQLVEVVLDMVYLRFELQGFHLFGPQFRLRFFRKFLVLLEAGEDDAIADEERDEKPASEQYENAEQEGGGAEEERKVLSGLPDALPDKDNADRPDERIENGRTAQPDAHLVLKSVEESNETFMHRSNYKPIVSHVRQHWNQFLIELGTWYSFGRELEKMRA